MGYLTKANDQLYVSSSFMDHHQTTEEGKINLITKFEEDLLIISHFQSSYMSTCCMSQYPQAYYARLLH